MNSPVSTPPPSLASWQDQEHLKLLSIFYYIFSGLSVIGVIVGIFYTLIGMSLSRVMASAPSGSGSSMPAPLFESMFTIIGVVILLTSIAITVLNFLTAKWIKERKNRTFCMVIAGISCISFPLGTALGVFTFIVLMRPTVEALFLQNRPGTPPQA